MNKNDFYNELTTGINELSKLIKKYKNTENIEIELRLGQIQFNGFNSGLGSKTFYDKIKSILDSSKCWSKIETNNFEELCNNGIRRTISINGKKVIKHNYIKKEKIETKDLEYSGTPYDIRICVSKETPIIDKNVKIKTGTGIIRKKNRTSYYYKDYVLDLTIVEQIENNVSEIKYELEVEFLNLLQIDKTDKTEQNKTQVQGPAAVATQVTDVFRAHSGLLLIRDMINMCEKIEDGSILESVSDKMKNMKIN
jgi:hypothetical protein